jgi:hypothetical protein
VKYKVLITTSGIGSRLGEITKYTNKSLVKVGRKPAISYIIENYPKNIEFVITLGHFGKQVKNFLKLAYPKRKFTFVNINKYQGEGSSLAYSLFQTSSKLHCPFIFHACDTIVTEKIPPPTKNWSGGFKASGSSLYRSFDVLNHRIQQIYDKGTIDPDFLHIGLVGIKTYSIFWKELKTLLKQNPLDSSLSDVDVIRTMINSDIPFFVHEFKTWYDVGNTEGLYQAKSQMKDPYLVLDKPGESIFIFKKSVIKFFKKTKIIINRVKRAQLLKPLVPEIISKKGNFYKYRFVRGTLYANIVEPENFKQFLYWLNQQLWLPSNEVSSTIFKKKCFKFYRRKTEERVSEFLDTRSIKDEGQIINQLQIPPVKILLKKIDWNRLCDSPQSNFHGDLILDNIIKTSDGYCLLDWRQDFAGLLKSGDKYYDLAKLHHNLIVNHEIINNNQFTVEVNNHQIKCDILRKNSLVECEQVLFSFIKKEKLDLKKVKLLTAIIWLNMSPLHHHPFDLFLYYFGKYNLWNLLKNET